MVDGNDNDAAAPGRGRIAAAGADLRIGIAFLTRLPPPTPHLAAGALVAAAWTWPVVGAALGACAGAAFAVAAWLGVSDAAAALIAVGALAALTGALHEDGLADAADGLGGGTTPARRLEIMRDSRIGTYGVVALVLALGLRVAALAALAAGPVAAVVAGCVAAAALSRAAMAPVMRHLEPAADSGLGAAAGRPTPRGVTVVLAVGLVVAAAALLAFGAAALLLPALFGGGAAALVALAARRRLGGYTGDVLGAVQQAAETAILVALAAVLA